MLTITRASNREGITVKQALEFSFERGVYLAPVNWMGETLMLCLLPQRLQQEFTQAVETRGTGEQRQQPPLLVFIFSFEE